MKFKNIGLLCVLFGVSAQAESVRIQFEKICVLPDDRVMDTVDFYLLADTETMETARYSKLMSLTPQNLPEGKVRCYREDQTSMFDMKIPLVEIGTPLRLQITEKSLFVEKLGFKKVFIGSSEQLKRIDCQKEDHQCIDIAKIDSEESIILKSKSELLKFKISLIK